MTDAPVASPLLHGGRPSTDLAQSPNYLVRWLLGRGSLFFAFATLGLSVVKYGAGVFPSWKYMVAIARHWQDPMSARLMKPPSDYLLDSPTSAVVAGMLHLTSDRAYLGLHAVLAAAAIVAPFALRRVRASAELRLGVFLLLVGGAVPALLLNWVGSYDPVSIAGAAVGALATDPLIAALGWLVFGFNNAPEAVLAFLVYAGVLWVEGANVRRIVSSGAAVVAGYIGVRVVTAVWGGGVSEVTMMKHYGYVSFLRDAVGFWPAIVFSALGAGWIFFLDRHVRAVASARVFVVLSVGVALVLPFIVLDASRLVSQALWPSALVAADLVIVKLGPERARLVLNRLAPVSLVVVIVLIWSSHFVYAGWDHLSHLLLYFVGHYKTPS